MKHKVFIVIIMLSSCRLFAATQPDQLQQELQRLQQQTAQLQAQISQLQKQMVVAKQKPHPAKAPSKPSASIKTETNPINTGLSTPAKLLPTQPIHNTPVTVHTLDATPESLEFYPTALVANEHVMTYIAGTPVVSSPYLGARPAFDGSDYIVNISSINRDIRLMQQRRRLYRAYESIGYPHPNVPIIALSGKVEPIATVNQPVVGATTGDITLGSGELDIAAVLNDKVEAYIGIAYDESPPAVGGQRIANSAFNLNMGFVNIGDLDESPFYFTGGQLFVPYGRFSTAMVSAPLTMLMARTKSRPFILGYKSQKDTGMFAALYGFSSDTTMGSSAAGGLNLGYIYGRGDVTGEVGASFLSSLNDSGGMQRNGSQPGTTFGGFSSPSNGSENVKKIPGVGAHWNMSFDRYNLTAEWVASMHAFRTQDLSFNDHGASPQAGQLEAGMTFMSFHRPSSLGIDYQWTRDALALNLPQQRISAVYNISIWKDTIESLEYRHDINYKLGQYANGAAPAGIVNANTLGTGGSSDTVLAQIGVFF